MGRRDARLCEGGKRTHGRPIVQISVNDKPGAGGAGSARRWRGGPDPTNDRWVPHPFLSGALFAPIRNGWDTVDLQPSSSRNRKDSGSIWSAPTAFPASVAFADWLIFGAKAIHYARAARASAHLRPSPSSLYYV